MRRVVRLATLLALALLLCGSAAFVSASGVTMRRAIQPVREPLRDNPALWGMAYEAVEFPSRDGALLRGWFVPGPSRAAVVLAHGLWVDRQSMLPIALTLHRKAGVSTLLFDFRSVGESDGDRITFGYHERDDLAAAVDYLKTRRDVDPKRIGALGNSLGAAVTLLTAAERDDIAAVAADSPFTSVDTMLGSSFQLLTGMLPAPFQPVLSGLSQMEMGFPPSEVAPLKAVEKISPHPLLLVHGLRDKLVPYTQSIQLYEAAGAPKELWLAPGADHLGARKADPDEYERRIVEFFKRNLRR